MNGLTLVGVGVEEVVDAVESDVLGPSLGVVVAGRHVEAVVEKDGLACYAVVEDGCVLLQARAFERFHARSEVWGGEWYV